MTFIASFDRRAFRLASLTIAGVALLSACDADRSIAPNRAAPDSASLALMPSTSLTGTLVIAVVDWAKNPAEYTGAFFLLSKPGMNDLEVRDNYQDLRDSDLAIGTIRVRGLVAGEYTVCQQSPPEHYVMVFAPCKTIMVLAGKTSHLEFINYQTARLVWRVVDMWQNTIDGGTFSGTDANGQTFQIADNGAYDLDDRSGRVEIDAVPGNFELCQVSLPAGYVLPAGQTLSCWTRWMSNGSSAAIPDMLIHPEYSARWRLRLNGLVDYPDGIGAAVFEVKGLGANGAFSKYVYDNGADDVDGVLGEFATILPAAGNYSVCQVTASNGYKLPTPACMRVTVTFGAPALVGWFFNMEI